MVQEHDAQMVSDARSKFLRQGVLDPESNAVRPEVATLWAWCVAAGLKPDATGIPEPLVTPMTPDGAVIPENLDGSGNEGASSSTLFTGELFAECANQLAGMGCIVAMLQTDCALLHVWPNSPTVSRAPDKALMTSTAAGLLDETRTEAWLAGAEHYLDSLQSYASYAWLAEDPFSRYMMCVILPQALFTDMFLLMIRNFRQRRLLDMRLASCRAELVRQQELFNQLKDIQEDALILVDYSQKILSVNRQFEQCFELSQADVQRRDLSEILPELESMLVCMRTGKAMHMFEVTFEGLSARKRTMYVNCTPWKQNGIINGMVLSLTASRRGTPTPRVLATHDILLDDLIGESSAFVDAKKMVRSVADSNSSIILTGESGTGKELFARAIHNDSVRAGKPFVAVNCSAIPKELIGSELFGYSDGAFTGARKGGAMGKFEFANGGTLLLDEIGELPQEVQAILLRVLEERSVVRIGDHKVTPVDVRIISATNRDLLQMIRDQTFRLDLYYRLNVINLELPPLRRRAEDIPLLAQSFVESLSLSLHKNVTSIAPNALEWLCTYEWPGNIRQLRNVVERGVNMAETTELRLGDLPAEIMVPKVVPEEAPQKAGVAPENVLPEGGTGRYEDWERKRIWELMQQFRANKSRIAEEMNMSRGTLYKKMRRYGL